MERNFYNEDFERFLKRSSEEYKMHPAEKVWRGVYKALHVRRKWYRFGVLFLLLAGGITGSLLNPFSTTSPEENTSAQPKQSTNTISASPEQSNRENGTSQVTAQSENNSISALTPDLKVSAAESGFSNDRTAEPSGLVGTDDIRQLPGFPTAIAEQAMLSRQRAIDDAHLKPQTVASHDMPPPRLQNNNQFDNAPIPGLIQRPSRFSLQFYFTPNVSYRKLRDNKSYLSTTNPFTGPYTYLRTANVDQAVTHKPDIGLEVGVAARYSLFKNVRVRAGLQFNMSRYDIRAFHNTPEVATIALRSGGRVDSFSTVSAYRNLDGTNRTSWLQNMYFQISAPIGVEMVLGGSKNKIEYGIAGTIQPTYMISDRAYMLSSDYKNYAEVPWLIRRWNANTSIETFVGYSTGTLRWHIGPQVRYQLLSSFVDEYPVKENLFNVGLKVGVSLDK